MEMPEIGDQVIINGADWERLLEPRPYLARVVGRGGCTQLDFRVAEVGCLLLGTISSVMDVSLDQLPYLLLGSV